MNLATFLMSLIGPLAIRALTMLGIGTITFTGVTVALQALIDLAVSSWASMGSDLLMLVSLAGIPQCIGMITGAMTARVGIWVLVSATRWVVAPAS